MIAKDPYEQELAARDPGLRAARGVYFTPAPLVRWMARSIDIVLRRELGEPAGLASPRVHLLDPAAGTGGFLLGVAAHARGARLSGREILREPREIAARVLSGVADVREGDALSAELDARTATPLDDRELLVVAGNPPYRGDAPPRGDEIERLLEDYKRGVRAEERQIQRLSNDYVRFFRLAQELVERRGEGVVAFVTDAGYVDGILFRDMRAELLRAFPSAWVLDLGGGVRRGARPRRDGNVFSITQPVAVGLFVKSSRATSGGLRYARLSGTTDEKLAALGAGDVDSVAWETALPARPAFLFRPTSSGAAHEAYARWLPLLRAAGTGDPRKDRDDRYGTGVKTRHDRFVVGFDAAEAVAKVRRLARRAESDASLVRELGLCTTAHFDLREARARAEDPGLEAHVRPIAFRPFDTRWVVHLREFVCEPKARTMRHLLELPGNFALTVLRRDRRGSASGYFAGAGLIAKDYVSNVDDALVWPLYVVGQGGAREPNLSPELLGPFGGDAPGAFAFVYAVLHAPSYRATFAEELSRDYPRLPLPRSRDAVSALSPLGARLLDVHLLRKEPRAFAPEEGSFRVGAHHPGDAWLAARRGRRLTPVEEAHHARVVAACAETAAVMREIDAVLAALGGFRGAFL